MNTELMERVRKFRTSSAVFSEMQEKGIITEEEKHYIDTILLEKYGLNSCSIFAIY